LIEGHAALQKELQEQRAGIDQDRREFERERRELALWRARDPIVAEEIGAVGTLRACLLPLRLAGYFVRVAIRAPYTNSTGPIRTKSRQPHLKTIAIRGISK
jgi:hypothetical protein